MTRIKTNSIALAIVTILAIGVALFSFRLLAPSLPLAPPNVRTNAFVMPWLPIHAGLSALALLVGPFQFWTDELGRRRSWHRPLGKIYIVACLASAPAGLILGLGSTAGPIAQTGFVMLAVLWFGSAAVGYGTARARRFEEHRRWMLRSYALTFAAVTLRLYLPIGPLLGYDFIEGYRVIAWASWVPNLLVAEWLARRPTTSPAALAMS